jgi:hypothetical protein
MLADTATGRRRDKQDGAKSITTCNTATSSRRQIVFGRIVACAGFVYSTAGFE